MCALAQLLIDPYYRTIEGFAVLIEKDFISFGHRFRIRNGFFIDEEPRDQESPVFILFLDCVYQLLFQFPTEFEFSQVLLVFLADCQKDPIYGTFISNNELERKNSSIKEKTVSVWSEVLAENNKKRILNPFVKPSLVKIVPDFSGVNMKLWDEYFGRNAIYEEKEKSNKNGKTEIEELNDLKEELNEGPLIKTFEKLVKQLKEEGKYDELSQEMKVLIERL